MSFLQVATMQQATELKIACTDHPATVLLDLEDITEHIVT